MSDLKLSTLQHNQYFYINSEWDDWVLVFQHKYKKYFFAGLAKQWRPNPNESVEIGFEYDVSPSLFLPKMVQHGGHWATSRRE